MIFFQQSSVVDKGMTEKDISFGKFDTAVGAFFTVVVAIACVIITGTLLFKPGGIDIESAAQAAIAIMGSSPIVGSALAIGLFDAGLLGAMCYHWQVHGLWVRFLDGLIPSTTRFQRHLCSMPFIS